MFEYLPSVISGLKTIKDMIATLQELRDFDKITVATNELKERLIDIIDSVLTSKEQLLTLQTKISYLEKECNRLKDWSAEKEGYSWRQISDGVSAYVDNNFKGNFQNARKLCCNCFDKSIKSTLQQSREAKTYIGRVITLTCPNGCPRLEFIQYTEHKTS